MDRKPLAKPCEVAEHVGVTEPTLTTWRYRSVGPAYIRVGKHVRYRWADVDKWLEGRRVQAV